MWLGRKTTTSKEEGQTTTGTSQVRNGHLTTIPIVIISPLEGLKMTRPLWIVAWAAVHPSLHKGREDRLHVALFACLDQLLHLEDFGH